VIGFKIVGGVNRVKEKQNPGRLVFGWSAKLLVSLASSLPDFADDLEDRRGLAKSGYVLLLKAFDLRTAPRGRIGRLPKVSDPRNLRVGREEPGLCGRPPLVDELRDSRNMEPPISEPIRCGGIIMSAITPSRADMGEQLAVTVRECEAESLPGCGLESWHAADGLSLVCDCWHKIIRLTKGRALREDESR
jgi:hypothetical protein